MQIFNADATVTTIKGLSERRRLPRLGVIRLGLKKISKTSGKEFPSETEYFVCPEEVRRVCGEKPTEIEVMIPINDIASVFPMAYKFYGSGRGLKCQGDGVRAWRVNEETRTMDVVNCPCDLLESGKCKQSANLMVIIPEVSVGGVYQIRTSSYNSIVDIQSGLDYVDALVGHFALVPLKLRRVKTETHHDGKKQNHFTLQLILDANIKMINEMRRDTQRVLEHPRFVLPAPADENPEFNPIDVVVEDEEDSATEGSKAAPSPPPESDGPMDSEKKTTSPRGSGGAREANGGVICPKKSKKFKKDVPVPLVMCQSCADGPACEVYQLTLSGDRVTGGDDQ